MDKNVGVILFTKKGEIHGINEACSKYFNISLDVVYSVTSHTKFKFVNKYL
jgi:hypothetical protein